jgi:transaldolase
MNKAYRIYRERGYRLRLLSAAFRNHLHWSEFIGGDVVISPPFEWQKRFNESDVTVENRMDQPVNPAIVEELQKKFMDFRRAFDEKGMTPAEFDDYGATRRTLRQFCKAVDDLAALIRDQMIPDPDK